MGNGTGEATGEGRTVTKYTLVPIGAVVLAVSVTASGMYWYFQGRLERESRISTLEAKMSETRNTQSDIRSTLQDMRTQMTEQKDTLSKINESLRLIKYRLNIGDTPTPEGQQGSLDLGALNDLPAPRKGG